MAVKTQWFVPDLVGDDGDPLEGNVDVTEVGVKLDLRDDPERLFRVLASTLEREQALYDRGLSCKVKELPDTVCHACPYQGVKGVLCELGLEQERLVTQMAVAEKMRGR